MADSSSNAKEDGRAKRPRLDDEDDHTKLQQQQQPQERHELVDEENDWKSLLLLQQEDKAAFVSVEERERRNAEVRRRQRQQRLQELRQQQQQQQQQDSREEIGISTNTTTTTTTNTAATANAVTAVAQKRREIGPEKSQNDNVRPLKDLDENEDDDDDDDFDMFSSPVADATLAKKTTTTAQQQPQQRSGVEQQDWDDAEGYYKAVIGEIIHLDPTGGNSNSNDNTNNNNSITLRVAGVIGKGVFSTVLQCTTLSNSSSIALPPVTAVKFIRHNETMARAALTEIQILQRLRGSPGIVPMLLPTTTASNGDNNNTTTTPLLEHRGHTILVFNFMQYNLRDVLQKFGKGVGLSLSAVRSYFGQLLAAATHLQKHHILHLDLKPDNILVSADFAVAQLADFGSAADSTDEGLTATPAPYLVSRFYRAPELILGLTPVQHAVDLWSLAVTVAELYLGNVLFRGTSNNDMLYIFQQHLGPCPNRLIRQHLVQCQKYYTGSNTSSITRQHFRATGSGASYYFLQQTADPVTGAPVHRELPLVVPRQPQSTTSTTTQPSASTTSSFPWATPLHPKLIKAQSAKEGRRMVQLFSGLLQQCLVLDPTKRIALKDALRHEFFQPPRNNRSSSNHHRTLPTSES